MFGLFIIYFPTFGYIWVVNGKRNPKIPKMAAAAFMLLLLLHCALQLVVLYMGICLLATENHLKQEKEIQAVILEWKNKQPLSKQSFLWFSFSTLS